MQFLLFLRRHHVQNSQQWKQRRRNQSSALRHTINSPLVGGGPVKTGLTKHTFVMSLHILLAIIKLPFRNSQPVSVGSSED